ncbi:MAG: hypothetical protein LBN93_10640 [Candidatus Symbiothrix sp.]|jgi:hypothetical protein|nr:hypothetical protein [Candidatus Symbiothrix sp.]
MKTKLAILFIFAIFTLSAKDYEPITLIVSGTTKIEKTDNSNPGWSKTITVNTLQEGDSITLLKPYFDGNHAVYKAKTANGFVEIKNLKLDKTEKERYIDWAYPIKREKKPVISEFEYKQNRLQASMKTMSKTNTWHDYLTVFTGELELNFSHLRFLTFLAEVMKMSEVSNDYEGDYIVSKCVQRTSKGNPEQLTIRYKVRADNGYFFPETVEITGTNRKVIELFISYWPSKIQHDDAKKGVQYDCYYTPDRVTLSIDKSGKASIYIANSQK